MRFETPRFWYANTGNWRTLFLMPFSWLFAGIVSLRRLLYRSGFLKVQHFPVPLIVVGNLTVGGTGKTPFVIWLANWLKAQGHQPGIVSRGVGGKVQRAPQWVTAKSTANLVGDEAILLQQQTACPVVVAINRTQAVAMLLEQAACDIVISDDGLQHYRLGRDCEIVMLDGVRRFGNGYLLPAGPLREPLSRLRTVTHVVVNGGKADELTMTMTPVELVNLLKPQQTSTLSAFATKKIHAVAALGHPERFFTTLRQAGFDIIPHVFPDHHLFQADELCFADALPIVMTEKDAVKCSAFANEQCWYLKTTVNLSAPLISALSNTIKRIT